jgi:O-antigen ligase
MRRPEASERAEWTPERVAAVSRAIVLVAISAVALGIFASIANAYYVAGLAGSIVVLLFVSWRFEAALIIYALAAFIPWGQTPDLAVGLSGAGRGMYASQIMLCLLLSVWLLKYFSNSLPQNRIRSGFHVPISLYLAYSVLNVVHSYLFWDPHVSKAYQSPMVNIVELGLRVLSAAAFAIVATGISSREWLKWTTIVMSVPGLVILANRTVGDPLPLTAPRWEFIALLPISYCMVILLSPQQGVFRRTVCGLVILASFYVILFKDICWVSGWLGLLAGLGLVTYFCNKRVLVLSLVVLAVIAVVAWPFFQIHVVEETKRSDDLHRIELFAASWRYATTFPLGIGIGNYRSYHSYHYGRLWNIPTHGSAHGIYAQHLTEMGIPGLVLFVAILLGGYRWMLKSYREMETSGSKTLLLACMAQLVGVSAASIIGDYIIPSFHNGGILNFSSSVYSWMFWGLAVAHVRLCGQPDSS